MLEIIAPSMRAMVADTLTISRLVVAAALLARPSADHVVLLVLWAWVSDALDGAFARWSGGATRLGRYDHVVDSAVGGALVWYLGDVGWVPLLPSRVAVLGLLVLWAISRTLAVQMLLETLAYGGLLWWVMATTPRGWWLLPGAVFVFLGIYWRRFMGELVPGFLYGWWSLLRGAVVARGLEDE